MRGPSVPQLETLFCPFLFLMFLASSKRNNTNVGNFRQKMRVSWSQSTSSISSEKTHKDFFPCSMSCQRKNKGIPEKSGLDHQSFSERSKNIRTETCDLAVSNQVSRT